MFQWVAIDRVKSWYIFSYTLNYSPSGKKTPNVMEIMSTVRTCTHPTMLWIVS